MTITETEFQQNQDYYLSLASREDIIVTKNGKFYAKIIGPRQSAVQSVRSLFGILPSDVNEKEILAARY